MRKLKIHFVGIKGVGMTPLAIIAKEAGFAVTGSDVGDEFITDKALKEAKIIPLIGFEKKHIGQADVVITTGAHGGYDNIEVKEAREKGIKIMTQGEAVGVFMSGAVFDRDFIGVSIAGTHGKTTTSAMIATILKLSNLDPTYVIGTGSISSLDGPGHLGKGKHFIAEADEYATEPKYEKKAKFLWQSPKIAVITNIEFDHPDIYPTIDEMRNAYIEFANQLGEKGVLIACGDDPEIKKVKEVVRSRVITYGFEKTCDYVLDKVHISGSHMFFSVVARGTLISNFMINVVGEHNALNALSAIIVCLELGLSVDKIKKGILGYIGSKRRMEYVGELRTGAFVYDDYAHHPTEIKKTLRAIRQEFPNKKIITIFQPHMYSRTKKLLDDFIRSFSDSDIVLITKIYASQRESYDPEVSSEILTERIKREKGNVFYLENFSDVVKYLSENKFRSDTVIVTMGAGDIYKLHQELNFNN
jgi:UDP-N-acetylmuramate--alanine ligase